MIPTKKSPVPSPVKKSAVPEAPLPPQAPPTFLEVQTAILENNDYGKLSKAERNVLILKWCENLGLDPTTRPFGFINTQEGVKPYAFKSASDGISKNQKLTDESFEVRSIEGGAFLYVVSVCDQEWIESGGKKGRRRFGVSAVGGGLTGTVAANAHKKADTQCHRRAILALAAPGFLDESEISDIPGARDVDEPAEKLVGAGSSDRAKSATRKKLESR